MLVERLNAATKHLEGTTGWTVFDRNLAKQVLVDHELPQTLERFMVEDARLPVEAIVEELLGLHPTPWALVQQTTQTFLHLAGWGRVVLVGRGAEIITKRLPYVFHVRLVAPLKKRIQHTAEYYNSPQRTRLNWLKRRITRGADIYVATSMRISTILCSMTC